MSRFNFKIGQYIKKKGSSIVWRVIDVVDGKFYLSNPVKGNLSVAIVEVHEKYKLA